MGQVVFILGRSGTGKSFSMRNFPDDKLAVINVQGKILPFRNSAKIEQSITDKSEQIIKALDIYGKKYKSIVIDDYQYTMANEFMRRSTERGYDKFTEIGRHAWDIVNKIKDLSNDVIVYIMCHIDKDEQGNEKIKTIGKLLDDKICLEGMSTIVLKTNVTDGQYTFLTQNNGMDTAKSPAGMFPSYAIDNDLYYVDQKIRNYYGLGEFITDEEAQEIDELAKRDDIPITNSSEKKSRKRKKADEEKTEEKTEEKEEKPKRTRRKAANEEEKEQIKKENDHAVATTNLDETGEDIPIEDAEEPEIKEMPRRKRRTQEVKEEAAEQEEPQQEPVEPQQEEAPTRRRRRR